MCVYVCGCVCMCVDVVVGIGWLLLVGPLKLDVSFAEYSLLYRAFLQKRPVVLRQKSLVKAKVTGAITLTHHTHPL